MPCFALTALFALLPTASAAPGPRDELLRIAPADAAIVVVVQNARDQFGRLRESPFAEWAPSTAIGQRILQSSEFRQLRDSAAMILHQLEIAPETLIDDVVGDAFAFAFSPPPPGGKPKEERAVILIRPRKMAALQGMLDRINELQTKSGELKSVTRKKHGGATYFERRKSESASEFYCFRGDVFAFSSSEIDIQAVIDRDRAAPAGAGKTPELVERMRQLGVVDAAGVILINPRALDAEIKARIAAARPDEKRVLARFAEVWAALDAAAIYGSLDTGLEAGVSLRFRPERLPADFRKWLVGPTDGGNSVGLIPASAIVGVAGHVRAAELIDLVASIAPVEPGKPDVKESIAQAIGPVFGRDRLATVLHALGPNWAVWADPPANESFLPTIGAAIEIAGSGENRARAEKAMAQGIEFGFQLLRVAYNAKHTDQIELKEEKDGEIVIRSLVNDKGFPAGFRPSFALVKGHLVIATSAEPIHRFTLPPPTPTLTKHERILARISGPAARSYLETHGARLAGFLVAIGVVADEKSTRDTFAALAAALELIETVELVTRGNEYGLQLAVKIKPARPLKK
jgi:hypothetical protein